MQSIHCEVEEMSEELKPCPFCGSGAEYSWEEAGLCSPNQPDLVTMFCTNDDCGAVIHTSGKEPNEAIQHWNQRIKENKK